MLLNLQRFASALGARPSEVAGLVVVLLGGVLATAVLALGATGASARAGPAPGPVVMLDGGVAASADTHLTVHVAGAVRRPGVVLLASGARVADAVEAAGGARPDAQLDGVNLAALVEDGQQVTIPSRTLDGASAMFGSDGRTVDGRIDLNAATAADLDALPGIGPVLASRIISWRDQHGPFTEPGQLREVPGIGERTFQSLADLIRV